MVLSEVEHGVLVALVYHHRSYNLHHSSSQTDTPGLVGCPLGGKRFALRTHPPLRRELPSPSYFRFLLGARPPPPARLTSLRFTTTSCRRTSRVHSSTEFSRSLRGRSAGTAWRRAHRRASPRSATLFPRYGEGDEKVENETTRQTKTAVCLDSQCGGMIGPGVLLRG